MKILENNDTFPPYKYYVDVETKFLDFKPNCRVLPARHYNDSQMLFRLKKKYEPGESKEFKDGGFELYGPDGGIYNFGINEVIVHPFHLGMNKYFSKANAVNKEKVSTGVQGKRGRPKKDPTDLKTLPKYVPTGGKRGRSPLSPEVKALRDAEKLEKSKKGTGKRGRPKKD